MESQNETKHKPKKAKIPDNVDVPVPPDGGYGWIVLIAAFFISFIIDGCMYSFGILLEKIQDYYQASKETANLVSSLNTGFIFLSGPAIAGFANQFGFRPVIMFGAIVSAFVFVMSTFSPNIVTVMLVYGVLGGIAMGATYIPSVLIIAMYFEKKRGIATGITMAGSGFGTFVMSPFTEYLLTKFDWRMTNIILGSIVAICCILGALMRPLKAKNKSLKEKNQIELISPGSQTNQETTNIEDEDFLQPMYKKDAFYTGSIENLNDYKKAKSADQFRRSNISIPNTIEEESEGCTKRYHFCKVMTDIFKEMTNFKLLIESSQFLLIVAANFFVFCGFFIPFIFMPDKAKEVGIDSAAWLISIMGITNIPSRILFGLIADRKIVSAWNLNTFSFILCVISNLSIQFLSNFWTLAGYSVVFAIGFAGFNSLTSVYLVDIVGLEKLTNATGIMCLFRGIGCLLGPYLGGVIFDKTKTTTFVFLYAALCYSIATVLVMISSIVKVLKRVARVNSKEYKIEGSLPNATGGKVDA